MHAQDTPFVLSFTAASLRPELGRVVAETYLACNDWQEAKGRVLQQNALQARTPASAVRMEREFRQRLQALTRQQLEILAHASSDSRAAISWLSVLKHSAFVFEFSAEVLRTKLELLDPVLRPSDYENFFEAKSLTHSELAALLPATRAKIERVIKTMLREVGILSSNPKDFGLRRLLVPQEVVNAVLADDRRWLAGFLYSDDELASLREV